MIFKIISLSESGKISTNTTIPQVCRYTTLRNVTCLKSNNWKKTDDFCNNTLRN